MTSDQAVVSKFSNWIIISGRNECAAFGPQASSVLLHHRQRLTELYRGAKRQAKLNRILNQRGINKYFVMNTQGDVLAASQQVESAASYMADGLVMVSREVTL